MRIETYALVLLLAFATAACDRGSKPALVGQPAPDFTVSDGDRSVTLSQYRGKIVVLNFWATWCPPCVEEMPSLNNMQKQLQDKVVVLAVSTDASGDAYKAFLRQHKIDFITVRDEAQHSNRLYGTIRLPETYIIDRDGVLKRKFIGPVDWTRPDIIDYLSKL